MGKNIRHIGLALALVLLLCAGTASAATYSGGLGTINEPYQLSSESDIVNLSLDPGDWDMNFILTDDITLVGNHTPIGNGSSATYIFTGDFDGNGHTISNLTIYKKSIMAQETKNVGFFGCIGASANIHDLGIETSPDGVYSTGNSIGGLVGINYGKVSNSHVTGNVSGKGSVGGLVGFNSGGTISNSYTTGNVSGSGMYVGGLVGNIYSGTVTNSYATGNVSGSNFVGGLAGANGITGSNAIVSNSSATGNVVTSNGVTGGLVGANNGAIKNCFATGTVSGFSVGGLTGVNNDAIRNCFATGTVTGTSPDSTVGGLTGVNNGAMRNSFATGTVTSTSPDSTIGGLVGQNNNEIEYCYYSSTGSYTNTDGSYTSYVNFTNFTFISGSSGLNWNENGNTITTADDSNYIWKITDGYTLPYFQWQDVGD